MYNTDVRVSSLLFHFSWSVTYKLVAEAAVFLEQRRAQRRHSQTSICFNVFMNAILIFSVVPKQLNFKRRLNLIHHSIAEIRFPQWWSCDCKDDISFQSYVSSGANGRLNLELISPSTIDYNFPDHLIVKMLYPSCSVDPFEGGWRAKPEADIFF